MTYNLFDETLNLAQHQHMSKGNHFRLSEPGVSIFLTQICWKKWMVEQKLIVTWRVIWGTVVEKSVQISTVIGNASFVCDAAETRQETA